MSLGPKAEKQTARTSLRAISNTRPATAASGFIWGGRRDIGILLPQNHTLKMGVARAGWTAKRAAHVYTQFSSVQSLSRVRLCDPTNCSTPGFPVHHQLPEFTQTHVHRVSDAVQSSHPLSSPSPPAPNPSQHQSLFQ